MKGMSKKLKKVLVLCFIFSLLANHFLILGELCNVAYAASSEMSRTSILSDYYENKTENEVETENEEGRTSILDGSSDLAEDVPENQIEEDRTSILDQDSDSTEESPEEDEGKDNEVVNETVDITEDNTVTNTAEDNVPETDGESEDSQEENSQEGNDQATSIMDNLVSSEEDFVKNDMILEDNDKNLEDNKNFDNQLSVESYQIDSVEVFSSLTADKFIKFDNESGKGVFLETALRIEFDKSQKKIETMSINLDIPKINELIPVYMNILNATSWTYNQETGKIDIQVENVDKFANNVCLEYKLMFVFTEEAYAAEEFAVNGIVKLGNTEMQIERAVAVSVDQMKETTDSFVGYKAEAENASIYKGYLKSNIISSTKNETSYDVVKKVEVKDSNFVKVVELEDAGDKLIGESGEETAFSNRYKKTLVSVENFEEILGTEGYIEIYTKERTLVGKIDKNSAVENNHYVFNYSENFGELIFRIVNPIKNGELTIKNQKAILDTNIFTDAQVEGFKHIKSNIVGKFVKQVNDTEIVLQSVIFNNEISLENTESKMKLSLDNTDLSTELENDVTINVTLETDEEKYELFKNPTIDIEFPYSVKDVEIKNINLLYKNGLSLDTWNVVTNAAGEKVIKVKLEGSQLEYEPGALIDGTQIVIYTTVKVDRLTANGTTNIKLKYTNEASSRNSYEVAGKESEDYAVNYVSKSGLIKATNFANFNEDYDVVTNYNNELNIASLDLYEDSKTAQMSMAILNNHSTEISNVVVIGRIPAVGNKDKDGKDLNTTIDTYLNREISVSGITSKVYYSENIDATKDDESWKETVEDITKVKSYKIVIENETMKKGESILFDYDLVIPEDLEYNQELYGIFSVYYDLNGETIVEDSIIGAKTEEKELVLEDCQKTDSVPEVNLGIGTQVTLSGKVIEENTEVREGQILKYKVLLSNNGTTTISNIKLKGTVENGNMYYKNTYEIISTTTGEPATTYDWIEDTEGKHLTEEFTIDKLEPGESKEVYYQIVTKNPGAEVYGKIEVTADNVESKTIETIKNKVVDSEIKLFVTTGTQENIVFENINSNSTFRIKTEIENISDRVLENLSIDVEIPKFMTLDEVMTEMCYDLEPESTEKTNSNIVTFYVDKLEIAEKKDLEFVVVVGGIDLEKLRETIVLKATTKIDDEEYISNDYVRQVEQSRTKFNADYTASLENGSTVKNGDEITYKLSVTNTGAIESDVNVSDMLPYGLDIKTSKITYPDGTVEDIEIMNKYLSETINIKSKETVIIEVSGVVNVLDCRSEQKYIANIFEVSGELENTEIKEYSYIIEYPEGWIEDDEAEGDNDLPPEPDSGDNENDSDNVPEEDIPTDSDDNNNEENPSQDSDDDNQEEDNINEEVPEESEKNDNEDIPNEKDDIEAPNLEDNSDTTTTPENNIVEQAPEVKEYSISGYVWYDANKDGLYNSEEKAKDITVYLFKTNNGTITENDLVKTAETDENGSYTFSNLIEASYIVVFSYDNTLYKTTKYITTTGSAINKSYVNENTIKINGEEKKYGLSDVINLTSNLSNINAGLVSLNEFDISIKTYLSSVTVANAKENTTYEFEENSKLNKVEIAAKYIDGTKITARYKISITNNGNISGYVNQIENIIPEGFEFNPDLNKNWTLGNDGKAYNSSMSNVSIKAGETKTFNLVLTKEMTSDTTGTFTNEARISNATNSLQIKDENEENNTSKTELMITIKTGAVVYISIIFIIIAISFVVAYFASKKLNKNLFSKKKFITILMICMVSLGTITALADTTETLSSMSLSDFYTVILKRGDDWNGTTEEINNGSTWMCVEGGNISGLMPGVKGRPVITWADLNKTYTNYKGYTGYNFDLDKESSGTNAYSTYLAFIGYAAQEKIYGDGGAHKYKNALADALDNATEGDEIRKILDLDTFSSAQYVKDEEGNEIKDENGNFVFTEQVQEVSSAILDDAKGVTEWFKINDNTLNANRSVAVIRKTSSATVGSKTVEGTSYIGPFKATYAIGDYVNEKNYTQNTTILTYRVQNSTTYSTLTSKTLYNSSGTSIGTINSEGKIETDLSNKEFYIKESDLPSNAEYVKLQNSHYEYRGRIVVLALHGGGQTGVVIRGDRQPRITSCEWEIERGCDVSVTKETLIYDSSISDYRAATNGAEKTYEIGDNVYFKITVTNKSGRSINMDIVDTFDSTYYEYVDTYNWTKVQDGEYKRNVTVDTPVRTYYINLKIKDHMNSTTGRNTVEIKNFKNSSADTQTLENKSGNQVTDYDFAKTKTYEARINKYIVEKSGTSIRGRDSDKTSTIYAEPGETIKFAIAIINTGTAGNNANGNIKNISFTDTLTNEDYVYDIKYCSTEIGTYSTSLPTGWSKITNGYKYTGSIAPKKTAVLYVQCKVKPSKTNITVTNSVKITQIENKNSVVIYNATKDKMQSITATSSDKFTIKKYTLNVSKTVYQINGGKASTASPVQVGDTITYKITIINAGTNSMLDGKIYQINLTDYFDAPYLKYSSHSGTNWSLVSSSGNATTTTNNYRYTNANGFDIGESTTLYVTLEVKTNIKLMADKVITNTAEITSTSKVTNKKGTDIRAVLNGNLKDSANVTLAAYKLKLTKYISAPTSQTVSERSTMKNTNKNNSPVEVEKGNKVTYTIKVENVSSVEIPSIILEDIVENGLSFVVSSGTSTIKSTLTTKTGPKSISVNANTSGNTKKITYTGGLGAGESLQVPIQCDVTASNLHLQNIKNTVDITSVTNRNGIEVVGVVSYTSKENEDYVRLKDLIISGTVWQDADKDGMMDTSETRLNGITVNLYNASEGKVATTTTNNSGYYKFPETTGVVSAEGRVVKGTEKNATTGNYSASSELIDYYIEFEYNGLQYRATDKYASDTNINSDGTYKNAYKTDSNATECSDLREALKDKFETISFNKATGTDGTETALSYTQSGNRSTLNKTNNTKMNAYSFINTNAKGSDGLSANEVKYLWLYDSGETEYLKYINLGLIDQKVDLNVTQDVYQIRTTVNGQGTTYQFNKANTGTYKFALYNSDYFYNPKTYYTSKEVIAYKENTELDVEVTYKITVTNENVGDGRKNYAVIKELVDYYSEDFVEYGTVANNIKEVKIADNEGFLNTVNRDITNATYNSNRLSISSNNKYGEKRDISGYNNLYITGLENIKLYEGASYEIYVTFTLGKCKNVQEAQEVIDRLCLGEQNNIVEINAYSVYESDGTPAGLVDRDSNPGNIDNNTAVSKYEDDTDIAGVEISLNDGFDSERKVTGVVWNDTRSEDEAGQYIGNGKNTEENKTDIRNANAAANPKVDDTHDITVKDVKVEMVEQIRIKQDDGTIRIYEEKGNPWNETAMSTRSGENGEYTLSGFVPGNYVTRFTYGDTTSESMLIYNGQDYKSTTFNSELDEATTDAEVLSKLEEEGLSDARDDEIRRLEVNAYAEKMNNEKLEILNQTAIGTTDEFVEKTNMYAETVEYKVLGEKNGTYFTFNQFNPIMSAADRYQIRNVDFGIEYRPEVNFELNKYISNIQVTLSSGTKLFDIVYKNVYQDGDTSKTIIGTEIDEENSIGVEKYQYLEKTNITKGFGYLNTDVDLLQGATVKIKYLFVVDNLSEVDRIGEALFGIRYKKNLSGSWEKYLPYVDEVYTSSGTAKNWLSAQYYAVDGNGDLYKTKEKTNNDYYGSYLGGTYYGKMKPTDYVAEMKINKVLDYVDTDLTFNASENSDTNNFWTSTTSQALYDGGYVNKAIFENGYLVDSDGVRFDTDNVSNLAVTVDDRETDEYGGNKNTSLADFLAPEASNYEYSFGTISLVASKVIASENDTDNMTFDNTAEVIEYTSQTGRVTNLRATIGNADIRNDENTEESDTSYTETISLIPPTGAYTISYYMSKHMNKILAVIALVVVIGVGIFVKKNIKNIKKRYK